MLENKEAFTLIELLVIVLIIGLLAVEALSQYKFAVAKSQTTSVIGIMHDINVAEKFYFLTHGIWSNNLANLDLQFPVGDGLNKGHIIFDTWNCFLKGFSSENTSPRFQCKNNDSNYPWLELYLGNTYGYCWPENKQLAKKICNSLPGARNANGLYSFSL